MKPGEVWAYRARQIDDIAPVRVLRIGTKKPARVYVQFEDLDEEGRMEWVPPSRLKVPWAEADAYRRREARWDALLSLSPERDAPEIDAAFEIFRELVDSNVGEVDWRRGYLTVKDPQKLADVIGVTTDLFADDPASFEEDGARIVSWPVAEQAVRAVAERNAEVILAMVDTEEREVQRSLIHGESYRSGGKTRWIEPEIIQKSDDELGRPRREFMRRWCGQAATDRWDELAELRKEIKRVGDIAEAAINELRSLGETERADALDVRLGQTVEMLRAAPPK